MIWVDVDSKFGVLKLLVGFQNLIDKMADQDELSSYWGTKVVILGHVIRNNRFSEEF